MARKKETKGSPPKAASKSYNPAVAEDKIYEQWEKSGYFNPDKLEGASDRYWKAEPFSIAMPPPNVTGELHLGHAMYTIQDIIVRHARMSGKKTLWLPGTDHAAIATNFVVERQIWDEEKKTRFDLGREEFLARVEKFIAGTRGKIQVQLRKMGFSADWSREKYTLSPELSLAVRTAFKKMYDAGLVYRGDRMVNWCPRCGTTLSDDEVVYREAKTEIHYIRYPFPKSKGGIVVATARPETMLGDTALAVHPEDKRYKKYIGETVMQPLVNRELKIIADASLDPEYGTGAIKVTPAHDHHDFDLALKNNLEIINVFGADGKVSEQQAADYGFEEYAGLAVAEARKKVVENLTALGFLEKTEQASHNTALCYRCETPVEPIISKQWFVGVNQKSKITNQKFRDLLKLPEEASLKDLAAAAIKSGAIKIVPERFTKTYLHWVENLRDWNISRQIWFGHRIPVYYCKDCRETIVAVAPPVNCPACNSGEITQDEDTLDTWFSSSLWTFSTLGWPEDTADLAAYHPTGIMVTGYDILFFWIARMIIVTGFVIEDIPFRQVYLHGLVRDAGGKKMSKSRGNVANPVELVAKFGADALRLSLVLGVTAGNDIKISESKLQSCRNLVNKLWNVGRFILSASPGIDSKIETPKPQTLADEWILAEFDSLTATVNKHFSSLQFALAAEALYEFTWNKFADWYIEISKVESPASSTGRQKSKTTAEILLYILRNLLKLWHPFIPFVTEQIWSQISSQLLIIQDYPGVNARPLAQNPKMSGRFESLQNLIQGLRNLRSEYREPPGEILASYAEISGEEEWIKEQRKIIEKLARARMNFEKIPDDKKMPYFLWHSLRIYLIIPNFNPKKERQLAEKELKTAESQLAQLKNQLSSSGFLKKAPAEVVEKIKTGAQSIETRAGQLKEKIKSLK